MLTREQRDFIGGCGVIDVFLPRDKSPYSFPDEDGAPSGVAVDVMELISKSTGMQFKFHFNDDKPDNRQNGQGGNSLRIDCLYRNRRDETFVPLLEGRLVFVGGKGMEFKSQENYLIAASEKLPVNIRQQFPNFKYTYCASDRECMDMVLDGKSQAAIVDRLVLLEMLQNTKYRSLYEIPAYYANWQLAVSTGADGKMLREILVKALNAIPKADITQTIVHNTTAKAYKPMLTDIIHLYKIPIFIILMLIF